MAVAEITKSAQYLTFQLDREAYAVDVTSVQEILEVPDINHQGPKDARLYVRHHQCQGQCGAGG